MRKYIKPFKVFCENVSNVPDYLDSNGYSYLNPKINRTNYKKYPKEIFYIAENDEDGGVTYETVFTDFKDILNDKDKALNLLYKYDVEEYDDTLSVADLYKTYLNKSIDEIAHDLIQNLIIDEFPNELWAFHTTVLNNYLES
jgi:hypothetical protein